MPKSIKRCMSIQKIRKSLLSCLFVYLFIFGCAGSSLLRRLFSSCGKQGLLSSGGIQVSHCSSFSCGEATGTWALECKGSSSCGSWALEHRLNSCSTQA